MEAQVDYMNKFLLALMTALFLVGCASTGG
jgi:hypothetical protein